MINKFYDISPGRKVPDIINAIIEIPKGSKNKYEIDKKTGLFKLDRVLNVPFHYATEYGIIPQTLGEDNDPLDVLVLIDQPTFPGCLIEVRPVAMLDAIDSGKRDVKILSVPVKDVYYSKKKDLKDVNKNVLKEIEIFFREYKRLQKGTLKVKGWKNAAAAKKEILKAIKAFEKKR
jgi:inorganic pyrophosphatase